MSRLITNAIRSTSASADAITMDGSGNVTFPANATCSGTATGFGKILQVVQVVKQDVFTLNATGTFDVTGLSVNITPSDNSNKILVQANICGHAHNGMGGAPSIRRVIGGTTTVPFEATNASNRSKCNAAGSLFSGDETASGIRLESANIIFLDSPNTTSQVTYKWSLTTISSSLFCVNRSESDTDINDFLRGVSSIVLSEVAG
tara:strand:+ start:54 stop:665 length:612 start_codon:yes stop_codon:yes gene_type:complete